MSVLILDANAAYYAERIRAAAPSLDLVATDDAAAALAAAPRAKVIVGLAPRIPRAVIAAATGLEWIQALTTGIDAVADVKGVAITNCNGIHGPQMTEHAVLLMLASARRFARVLDNQKAHAWERWPQPLLEGKTACILGLGAIAEHMVPVLKGFGMRLVGVSSRASAPGFDAVFPRARLHEALGEADFVIVLTPLTPENRDIIDAAALGAMKPSAHLLNLARGGCVNEAALAAALKGGTIAGAASDVFEAEPLPPGHPLWDAPNHIVTPHLAGYADVYHRQAAPIVAANMADYAAGGVAALKGRLDA